MATRRHPATRCYSYAAAVAASGHPRPALVLAHAAYAAATGTLQPRAAGVTQAMRAARANGATHPLATATMAAALYRARTAPGLRH